MKRVRADPLPSVRAAVADPLGLELRRPGEDHWAVILPNTTLGQGPCKVQYFTRAGLASHHVYATPQAALRAALRTGYTEADPGALNRLAASEAWRRAYTVFAIA